MLSFGCNWAWKLELESAAVSDVFISYARETAPQAQLVAEALRAEGFSVWRDDEIPAHRPYATVIAERLRAAKAVVVIWSAAAAESEWVQSEADVARSDRKIVQMKVDATRLPMPFGRLQCANLTGWSGDTTTPGWHKVVRSVAELVGDGAPQTAPAPAVAPSPAPASRPLTPPNKPSIAVMPFANLSGDPEQDYFADGMVAEIIERLSCYRNIFVIAHGSTRSFKGREVNAQAAARQLGVRFLLEGNVRKAGGRVRIGVQLIDTEQGTSIWSQRFEDTLEDVFALQDRVALAVAGKMEPTINAAEFRRVANRPTEDMDSYDLYLRGHASTLSHSKAATLAGLELLNRSIALDPDFGLALVRAAHCHRLIWTYGWSDNPEADRQRCLDLVRRALQVAGDDATVVTNASYFLMVVEGDDKTAIALIERSIELNPGHARMFYWSGRMRLVTGDTERGLEHLQQSMRLDPIGSLHNEQIFGCGLARFAQGRFAEAVTHFRESGLYPQSSFACAFMAACQAQLGDMKEARAALERYRARSGQSIDELALTWLHDPAQRKLFLDGIAAAAGDQPTTQG